MPYSVKMLSRLRGSGRTSGATEKLKPTACPGVGYGILPDDQHPHLVEREREGAQHIRTSRQVPVARRDLGPQELPHLRDLWADGFQCAGPARLRRVHAGGVPSREANLAGAARSERLPARISVPRRRRPPAPAAARRAPGRSPASRRAACRGTSRPARGPRRRRAPTPTRRAPTAAAAPATASRSAASAAVDTSIPTPDAVRDMAEVGHQPVGHVRHRRRARIGGDAALTVRRFRHQMPATQRIEAVEYRCATTRYPAADRPSSPATASVSPGRAPLRQHRLRVRRGRRARSPRSPTAGR